MSTQPDHSATAFQNRVDELQQVLKYVESGEQPILVMAMPTMGKSRFLDQLPRAMDTAGLARSWETTSPVNLGENDNAAARFDLGRLLTAIFPDRDWDVARSQLAAQIAQLIRDSGRSRLVLLDCAELLRDDVARELRDLLGEANRALGSTSATRIAFVAASRMEIPAFQGISPSPRFQKLLLKHFNQRIVVDALTKEAERAGLHHPAERYEALGHTVWQVTEGLPGLLEVTLEWMKDNGFALVHQTEAESKAALLQGAVQPYIRDTLLSLHVLLPPIVVERVPEAQRPALEQACRTLVLSTSACRVVTKSHLRLLAARREALRAALETIKQSRIDPYELFGALSVVQPTEELWASLYGSVRRLYFRYAWPEPEAQRQAHRDAQHIYEAWTDGPSQFDRARFLLERFYHEVEIVRLPLTADKGFSGPEVKEHLRTYFQERMNELGDQERDLFPELFRTDDELHHALDHVAPGLANAFL